ncbi:MAG: ABC transporter substrate-binding protein [Betaproteobacteria bacterium]|nr:ABC transporter substrate-binding protein [Betaproteobacteria bacterium]
MKKLLAFAAAACLSLPVFAQQAPNEMVQQVTDEVLDVVRRDRDIQNGSTARVMELVDQKVLPHFDFMRMTALAVGRDWRKASPQQQQQLANEFKTLLVRTYANALTGYRDQKVVYKPFKMKPEESEVLVRTEIQQPGSKPISLDYTLERRNGDDWKVCDVTVAGISLVTNYRDQFAQEVRGGGIDGLIASIAAKNRSLEANQAKAGKNK